jgi:hypothetical protein
LEKANRKENSQSPKDDRNGGKDLRAGDGLVLNTTIDERSDLGRGLLDVGSLLGDVELLEELLKDLDGTSVLGRHLVGFFYFVRYTVRPGD